MCSDSESRSIPNSWSNSPHRSERCRSKTVQRLGRATHSMRVRRERHAGISRKQGFTKVTKRLTKAATRYQVLADIKAAPAKLKRNEILFLTY